MLPNFDQRGYLPPGVHRAESAEVLARFGKSSELRREQAESLSWLISLCKSAGIARLIVNGSFVTNIAGPNDVDCVLLIGPAYNESSESAAELERGLPFLSLQIVRQQAFNELVDFFATDRSGASKGVVEIIL
jgi:hypothetical protein